MPLLLAFILGCVTFSVACAATLQVDTTDWTAGDKFWLHLNGSVGLALIYDSGTKFLGV